MKQYGSYSDADLTDWERLPLPSKVLTQSAFGAWLMRRDEHRDKAMNLIPKSILVDIRAEIDRQEKWLMDAGCNTYNVDIALSAIKLAVAESEVNNG